MKLFSRSTPVIFTLPFIVSTISVQAETAAVALPAKALPVKAEPAKVVPEKAAPAKVNLAPVLTTVTLPAAKENEKYTQQILAKDPEGQKLKYKLVQGPAGLTVSDSGVINWKPDFSAAGEKLINVEVSDGSLSTVLASSINTINTNRAPVLKPVAAAKGNEGENFQLQLLADDEDKSPLTFLLVDAPAGMRLGATGLIEWLPGYDQSGKYSVKVQVTDGEAKADQSFSLEIANTNRQPQFISQPITSVSENSAYAYGVTVTDPDGTPLKIILKQGPKGATFENDILAWLPDYESAGEYPVVFETSDGELSATQSFTLKVANVNRLPVIISKPVLKAIEGLPYEYDVQVIDEDNDPLNVVLKTAPAGMAISKSSVIAVKGFALEYQQEKNQDEASWNTAADGTKVTNAHIIWNLDYQQGSKQHISISVSDRIGTVMQDFDIVIENTNREPSLQDIKNQRVEAGDKFTYDLVASDVDGDKVKVKLVTAPKNMQLDEDNEIIWRTEETDVGGHTVIVSVSDGDLEVEKHFDINVVPDN